MVWGSWRRIVLGQSLLAALMAVGCAPAPLPLYGQQTALASSVIALDPGVCIIAAAHEEDRTQALQCGGVEVVVPAGKHILVAAYRTKPGYRESRLFALAFSARAGAKYRVVPRDMVYEFVRLQDDDCDSLIEEDGGMLPVPQRLVVRAEDGRPVASSRDDLLDYALSLHTFPRKCGRRLSEP